MKLSAAEDVTAISQTETLSIAHIAVKNLIGRVLEIPKHRSRWTVGYIMFFSDFRNTCTNHFFFFSDIFLMRRVSKLNILSTFFKRMRKGGRGAGIE